MPDFIPDEAIPAADPEVVVLQYELYIKKIANRYNSELQKTGAIGFDDLVQVGRIAILDAQKNYNPENGSFINCLFNYARKAMRRALGFNNQTGEPPMTMTYLDEPLSDDSESTRGDMIPDPNVRPMDEPIIEVETRNETYEQVHAALERMKSEKQKEVLTRVYLDGQERTAAAAEMNINTKALYALDQAGRNALYRDDKLKRYAYTVPFIHVGVSQFNTTWTSATEMAVLRLERDFDNMFGAGAFLLGIKKYR